MRRISTSELLDVWERGRAMGPAARALALLSTAWPDASPEALAHLSVGRRDARLMEMREAVFGSEAAGVADCPDCGERVELIFPMSTLRTAGADDDAGGAAPTLVAELEGRRVEVRLPDSCDLIAAAAEPDVPAARGLLLRRCIVDARQGDEPTSVDDLPEAVVAALIQRLAEADPQADVQLRLTCPSCGRGWSEAFDIVSFFWTEVDAWSKRILRDVHDLAWAYGWREADILAMSAWRRHAYLEMLHG